MPNIPSAAESLFMSFSIAFTQPTFQRILPLAIGAILTTGRRTVTGVLWIMRGLVAGHSSTYHRVFSRAVWSLWPLGKILAGAILRQIPPDEPVLVLSLRQIVSWFTSRQPIETTFQEVRAHLGFETPRQYVAKSVLRTAPCLLGLFSIICLIFAKHVRGHRIRIRNTQWYVKAEPTFSDVIATVRRLFWQETIFEKASHHKGLKKLPPKLRNMLLDYLSQAA